MRLAAALVASYLLGSFPTAYLLAKAVKGIDIRTVGSGNVGATNTLRHVGRWPALVVLLVDVLKGALASFCVPRLVAGDSTLQTSLLCGLSAVVGHNFPCFLGFRGGKGVATTLGVLIGCAPWMALTAVAVWLAFFLPTRYVSLGSIAAAIAVPTVQLVRRQQTGEVLLGFAIGLLIVARHHANLRRLLQGTEHRVGSPA